MSTSTTALLDDVSDVGDSLQESCVREAGSSITKLSQVIGGLVRGPLTQGLLVTGPSCGHEGDFGFDSVGTVLGAGCSEPLRDDIHLGFSRGVAGVPFAFEELRVETVQRAGPGRPLRECGGR